ncbi:hypothetical protein BHUM_04949c [Candidatus Burkholderia humilis]|nr:hypothetical protein BHUM_04949c [Candidatus Burkholderia humilis]
MKQRLFLSIVTAMVFLYANARADDAGCGTLEDANGTDIALREGENVNFNHNGRLTHGVLHIYKDGEMYRVYWQPIGNAEQYVLAFDDNNTVRLISNPPHGEKVDTGPGVLPSQRVLSCHAL